MSFKSRLSAVVFNVLLVLRLFSQHPLVNDDLPNRILSGTIQVKPNVRRIQGSSVEFDDGSVVEDVDLVVGLILGGPLYTICPTTNDMVGVLFILYY